MSLRFIDHFERDRAELVRVARRYSESDDAAEDVVGEALIKVIETPPSAEIDSSLSWLRRIVANTAIDRARREGRLRHLKDDFLEDVQERAYETIAPADSLPERERLLAALAELPERLRYAVILIDLEDLPAHEAALLIGISTSAIKSRLDRARRLLREALSE